MSLTSSIVISLLLPSMVMRHSGFSPSETIFFQLMILGRSSLSSDAAIAAAKSALFTRVRDLAVPASVFFSIEPLPLEHDTIAIAPSTVALVGVPVDGVLVIRRELGALPPLVVHGLGPRILVGAATPLVPELEPVVAERVADGRAYVQPVVVVQRG